MPPLDIAQLLAGLNTNTTGVPETGANLIAQEDLAQTVQRLLSQAGPQMPEPVDTSPGVAGLLAGIADAFQNKARGMAPNPGGISQGNALNTLRALRERRGQREDRQNFAQFRADTDKFNRDTRLELGAARDEVDRTRAVADRATQFRREDELFEKREDAQIAREGRAEAAQDRRDTKLTKQRLSEFEAARLDGYANAGLSTEGFDSMTKAEQRASISEQIRAIKLSDQDRLVNQEMAIQRAGLSSNVLNQAYSEGPGDLSTKQWTKKIEGELRIIHGKDLQGFEDAMNQFEDIVLPVHEKTSKAATADRTVERATGFGGGLVEPQAFSGPATALARLQAGDLSVLSELLGTLGGVADAGAAVKPDLVDPVFGPRNPSRQ